jgi:hypothetical protein
MSRRGTKKKRRLTNFLIYFFKTKKPVAVGPSYTATWPDSDLTLRAPFFFVFREGRVSIYLSMYVCTYARMYVCMYVCIHVHIHINRDIILCVHTHTHTHAHTCTHTRIHTHTLYIHTCTFTSLRHTHVHIHTNRPGWRPRRTSSHRSGSSGVPRAALASPIGTH